MLEFIEQLDFDYHHALTMDDFNLFINSDSLNWLIPFKWTLSRANIKYNLDNKLYSTEDRSIDIRISDQELLIEILYYLNNQTQEQLVSSINVIIRRYGTNRDGI